MTVLMLTLTLAAAPAAAAESSLQNSPWSAWYGCWQAEGAPAGELVCIAPVTGGVRMATLQDGRLLDESRIIADGAARAIHQPSCSGSERARWSGNGRRLFLDSDVTCANAPARAVRGMFAFVAPDEWVSVQTATQGDSVATRTVRFMAVERSRLPAGASAFAAARVIASTMFEVEEDDVAEAVENIGAAAAQEWLRLAGEPYQLAYQNQQGGAVSALEQTARMSNPVEVREVVREVERPVYVYNTYVVDRYHWHYSPWGYGYYGWRWGYRPYVYVRLPIVIYRNRDYRGYRYRDRYDSGHDHDWRDDRDYPRDRGGRVTRDGYSSGRDRTPVAPAPDRARADTRPSAQPSERQAVVRQTSRPARASSSPPQRSSAPRPSSGRTARPRTSSSN